MTKSSATSFDVEEDDTDAGLDTILASTEKILAVNKGIVDQDERDSLKFRKLYPVDRLLSERIHLDADKLFLKSMRRIIRQRNLKAVGVNLF